MRRIWSFSNGSRHRILVVVWGRNREPNWYNLSRDGDRTSGMSVVGGEGSGRRLGVFTGGSVVEDPAAEMSVWICK